MKRQATLRLNLVVNRLRRLVLQRHHLDVAYRSRQMAFLRNQISEWLSIFEFS
jgi:hypothetical protein